ncbi:hypothetical protein [Sediminispirochaeta bajacaliforniensis]|uniref:hypothetical protein n=1 Tax=Sediminispirochaeta bajacaliforniensis TaxID=148 RepID=UPI0004758035|nr:hypothetical protein [Sediminispirochaeta bajacaliforniensis]
MSDKNECFKMMKAYLPPLKNGEYTVEAIQNVTAPESDSYHAQMDFCVKGAHFSVPEEEIHSLYPHVNACGNYGTSMAHITFKNKSYPWEMSERPWFALICLSDDEFESEQEIAIKDLFNCPNDTFYPLKSMPACTEKPEDGCTILDLPADLYEAVMPRESEAELLAHVKIVDLYDTSDDLVSHDGYFSVIVSNRFIPSGKEDFKKNTMHLVSLEGYDGYLPEGARYSALKPYAKIRLVSLYSWSVFSTEKGDADFCNIITSIQSGPLALSATELLKRGKIPLYHVTRTGEKTVSLYRGPLIPYPAKKTEQITKQTADGWIIYDPEHGIMDLSYAAAWQLGRLLILKNKAMAAALLAWKKQGMRQFHIEANKIVFQNKMRLGLKAEQGDIVDYCAHKLFKQLLEDELVAPLSTASGSPKTDVRESKEGK